MEIKTKSRGGCCRLRLIGADGDASQKTSFPSCHHRHHQCHALHDDNSLHGSKKRLSAVQKVRLSPVQKQLRIEAPPQTLLKVRELIPAVFEVVIHSFLPCSNSHFHTGSTSMVPYWSSMLSDSSFVNINRRLQDNAPGIFFKALTSRS